MGQHGLIRGLTPGPDGSQQGAVKPAPVLIAAFQIEIGRGTEVGTGFQDRGVTHTGIEPDIQDVGFFSKFGSLTMGTNGTGGQELFFRRGKPDIGSMFQDQGLQMVEDLRGDDPVVAVLTIKGRDRDPPGPLAGQAPVRTVFHHAANPVPAPGRHPGHPVDLGQGLFSQVIGFHGDKPLLGGPKDHRFFTAPAMGIAVVQWFLHPFRDLTSRSRSLTGSLASKTNWPAKNSTSGVKLASIVHRGIDVQMIAQPAFIILLTVAGGGMNDPGAVLQGHIGGQDHDRLPVIKGMPGISCLPRTWGPGRSGSGDAARKAFGRIFSKSPLARIKTSSPSSNGHILIIQDGRPGPGWPEWSRGWWSRSGPRPFYPFKTG